MFLRAGVILPRDFDRNPNLRYPLRVHIGGFGTRYTAVGRIMAPGSAFRASWDADDAPRMVFLHLDGAGPLGDPYQVNSANHGPYGDAVVRELIPEVERRFRGAGRGSGRVLDGGSTGGWVALALQVFYPDEFQGAWSFCPDPVDFRSYQRVNIYEDASAYLTADGATERPSARDSRTGQVRLTMRQECGRENLLGAGGSYTCSGLQWGSWNATFSPKGRDGLPVPLWDPHTGRIDHDVAVQWRGVRPAARPGIPLADARSQAARQAAHLGRRGRRLLPQRGRSPAGCVLVARPPALRRLDHVRAGQGPLLDGHRGRGDDETDGHFPRRIQSRLTMSWDRVILALIALSGALGFVFLTCGIFFWRWIGRLYSDRFGGLAIALARAVTAFAAIMKSRNGSGTETWGWAQTAAIVSWLVWELAGGLLGWRSDRQKEGNVHKIESLEIQLAALRQRVSDAESDGFFYIRLLTAIRFTVLDRTDRIRSVLRGSIPQKASSTRTKEAFNPEQHLYLTLQQMGAFLRERLPAVPESLKQNFRVGLYVADPGGQMQPWLSVDILNRRPVRFTSFVQFPERFRLDNRLNPCYAVKCIQERRLLILPDADQAADFYFHEDQRLYLKSLIAYPILHLGSGERAAAIVIDTNVAGYFQEADRVALDIFAEEFAVRLNLELFYLETLAEDPFHAR